MRPAKILTAMIVLMSVSACGPDEPAPAAAPPAASAGASPAASAAPAATWASPEAGKACKLAAEAPRPGEAIEIDEQAIKAIVENAGKSGIPRMETAGAEIQARYTAWLNAKIGDEAAKAQDDLLTAVGQFDSACG
ncbi:hypothetical protein [Actinoplanes sp. L3-i22]|uniref:hypothetical protein n=1 Tax=Actinoplanes sp. L3-i22 TaxID=2836373 RepID=UPI001C840AD9|nr:hypothetical protein [Actinoplanes sp. L3-i22]